MQLDLAALIHIVVSHTCIFVFSIHAWGLSIRLVIASRCVWLSRPLCGSRIMRVVTISSHYPSGCSATVLSFVFLPAGQAYTRAG